MVTSNCDPNVRFEKVYTKVKDLNASKIGETVLLRTRCHNTRPQGSGVFVVMREELYTVQGTLFKSEFVSPQMIKFVKSVNKESIIEVKGIVKAPEVEGGIKSCTQSEIEIDVREFYVVHKSEPRLPFNIEDASRRIENQEEESKAQVEEEKDGSKKKVIIVDQDTRLNNRIIDLRVPANKAIFKIQSAVGNLF